VTSTNPAVFNTSVGGVLLAALALCGACSIDTSDDHLGPLPAAAGAPGSMGGTSSSGVGGGGGASVAGALPMAAGTASGGTNAGGTSGGGSAGTSGTESGGGGGQVSGGTGGAGGTDATGGGMKSGGCGQTRKLQDGNHMLTSGGAQRSYTLRVPANYDNAHPYRLMLGFHGATGKASDVAPSFFGLWELSEGSTIFAAPDAVGGIWNATTDTTLVSDLLKQLEADLCIDTSRVGIEGFSQGGAMVWTLACGLPGTFRVAVVHSGGGLPMPKTCQPIPFFSALGTDGSGQGMSSDFFAMTNGCMVEPLPMAPTGGHACTEYKGCSAGHPTRWCDYDAGHTPAATDSGKSKSWVPEEVWNFVKQF
jgi:hypothetical protein